MTGAVLNALAIMVGALAGLLLTRPVPRSTQTAIKIILGAFTIWVGATTIWRSVNGSFLQVLGQIGIALLAVVLGNVLGKLCRLQKALNPLGQYARKKLEGASQSPSRFNDGFLACTALYCATPIAVLGSVLEGASTDWRLLAIKALMDGFAAMAFVTAFGGGVVLSSLPVLAWVGTLTLGVRWVTTGLSSPAALHSLELTAGFLVLTVVLIVFELKRVELADYLPALAVAPLLTWLLVG